MLLTIIRVRDVPLKPLTGFRQSLEVVVVVVRIGYIDVFTITVHTELKAEVPVLRLVLSSSKGQHTFWFVLCLLEFVLCLLEHVQVE